MSKGFKIFLWVILVINVISAISTVIAAFLQPKLFISVALSVVYIVGIFMLIQMKKMGFFIMCGVCAINLVVNIFSGVNIALALVSAIVLPVIIYFLMKPNWDSFE